MNDMVKVYGMKLDGSMHYIGEIFMSPKMKATELVQEYFGPIEDGNEADTVLYICEQLLSYVEMLNKKGNSNEEV